MAYGIAYASDPKATLAAGKHVEYVPQRMPDNKYVLAVDDTIDKTLQRSNTAVSAHFAPVHGTPSDSNGCRCGRSASTASGLAVTVR
jgi:hypothetical protein